MANELADRNAGIGATTEVFLELSGASVFDHGDGVVLQYSASSSDEAVATVGFSNTIVALGVTGVAAGTAEISVTAADTYGNSATETFTVTVTADDNQAPTVANPPVNVDLTVGEDHAIAITAAGSEVFTDADNDPLAFMVLSSNESVVTAEIDNSTGTVTLSAIGEGSVMVLLFASDGRAAAVSTTFTVTVGPAAEQ